MDEVVSRVDTGQGCLDRSRIEEVGPHNFRSRRDPGLEVHGVPDGASHTLASRFEEGQQPSSNVAVGSGKKYQAPAF